MIGDMISKVRKEKNMTKTELADITGINIGHLSHIEKGERNPSHKALRNICKALDIPFQQLMYTYDKELNEEQEKYGLINHIAYNKVLAVDNLSSLIDCPANIPSASLAIKMPDNSMEKIIKKGEYIFIEFNPTLSSKNIGLFSVNQKLVVRRFSTNSKGVIVLKPENKDYENITISNDMEFYIIGKILNK